MRFKADKSPAKSMCKTDKGKTLEIIQVINPSGMRREAEKDVGSGNVLCKILFTGQQLTHPDPEFPPWLSGNTPEWYLLSELPRPPGVFARATPRCGPSAPTSTSPAPQHCQGWSRTHTVLPSCPHLYLWCISVKYFPVLFYLIIITKLWGRFLSVIHGFCWITHAHYLKQCLTNSRPTINIC